MSREVRIGELIAALVAISTIAGTYIELRLRPIEQAATQMQRDMDRSHEMNAEWKRELRSDLLRVEGKLDLLRNELSPRGGGR